MARKRQTPQITPQTGDLTGKQASQWIPGFNGSVANIAGFPFMFDAMGFQSGSMVGAPGYGSVGGGYYGCAGGNGYGMNQSFGSVGSFGIDAIGSYGCFPGMWALWPATYWYYRMMLRNSTLALARAVASTPMYQQEWVFTKNKNGTKAMVDFITEQLLPMRMDYLRNAWRSVDFGWAPLSPVYRAEDGKLVLKKIKPLLHEQTFIDVNEEGDFLGFTNNGDELPLGNSLLVTHDEESGNLYGRGRLENLRRDIVDWTQCDDSASRYDQKVAGVFLVMHYPPGESQTLDGSKKPNYLIAQRFLDNVIAGKGIALPNEFAGVTSSDGTIDLSETPNGERTRWKMEMMSDSSGRQNDFVKRLEYVDKRIFRGYHVPERAATESTKAGSRADSESQSTIIPVGAMILHKYFIEVLNRGPIGSKAGVVDTLLRMNFGEKTVGGVSVEIHSIADDDKRFRQELFKVIAAAPTTAVPMGLMLADMPQLMKEIAIDEDPALTDHIKMLQERAEQEPEAQPDDGIRVKKTAATKAVLSRMAEMMGQVNGNGHASH